MTNIRTDLALETHEQFTETAEKADGVDVYDKSTKDIEIISLLTFTGAVLTNLKFSSTAPTSSSSSISFLVKEIISFID